VGRSDRRTWEQNELVRLKNKGRAWRPEKEMAQGGNITLEKEI
jgi:hypothetical protein